MFINYEYMPKKKDIYTHQSKGIPFPFSVVASIFGIANKEKVRLKELQKIMYKQETNEFDFAPQYWSLRYGQSRSSVRSFFESVDVRLLRRTQDLVIQEAFLECLEDAGIDTSDFREGTAQINNYGIINSGQISGDAKTESSLTREAKAHKNKPKEE